MVDWDSLASQGLDWFSHCRSGILGITMEGKDAAETRDSPVTVPKMLSGNAVAAASWSASVAINAALITAALFFAVPRIAVISRDAMQVSIEPFITPQQESAPPAPDNPLSSKDVLFEIQESQSPSQASGLSPSELMLPPSTVLNLKIPEQAKFGPPAASVGAISANSPNARPLPVSDVWSAGPPRPNAPGADGTAKTANSRGGGNGRDVGPRFGNGPVTTSQLGNLNISTRKIAVVMDNSDSMQVARGIVENAVRLAKTLGRGNTKLWKQHPHGGVDKGLVSTVSELAQHRPDAIYWVTDLRDVEDESELSRLREVLLRNKIRLYVCTWFNNPSEGLMGVIDASGGAVDRQGGASIPMSL